MSDNKLPVPFFVTEEEQLEGGKALAQAGDTTVGSVENAVIQGDVIWDSDYLYVTTLRREGDLFYHIFRGPKIPSRFWGTGEFGALVLPAAKAAWPKDSPLAEFHAEAMRDDAVLDELNDQGHVTKRAENPPRFYGAYFVCIPAIDERPIAPDEERIQQFARILEEGLKENVERWSQSNGSNGS